MVVGVGRGGVAGWVVVGWGRCDGVGGWWWGAEGW